MAMPPSDITDAAPVVRPASQAWVEALAATATIAGTPSRLLAHIVLEQAELTPAAPALLSERETFTYAELARRIKGYAAWTRSAGLRKSDCVALMMSNRPDYVAIWLGLSLAGVVTALINTNLRADALTHCLKLAKPRHAIAEAAFVDDLQSAMAGAQQDEDIARLWSHGENDAGVPRIDTLKLDEPVPSAPVTIDDRALLIYTSGTTGLPKAAPVSHRRILNWALWFKGLLGNRSGDRMYNCLPLYHSVGGVVAVAATLAAGGSTVIAEKFSARRFWADVTRWDCTQIQYIGELCRYLLNAPATPHDKQHNIRIACGNGLREDVWQPFQKRFGIPQIVEFYASTEGSFSLFNAEGKPGAIGRIPPYLRHRFATALVKLDDVTGEPVRDSDGLCQRTSTGEAIGRIGGGGAFEGYTDAAASERKILRNVFSEGDAWFRSGDMMRCNAAGFYYFVDRLGDTFRWKGENVSTLEIASLLAAVPGVVDVTVYGVTIAGADGKAGMAFLDVTGAFNIQTLFDQATAALPAYAVPVFVRVGAGLSMTETFKHKKQDLVLAGFDPSATSEPIHVRLAGANSYRRLDPALHADILNGAVRL